MYQLRPTCDFAGSCPTKGLYDLLPYIYTNLTLPVSNTDIMPCLTSRALDSFSSMAEISASMSFRLPTFYFPLSTNLTLPVSNTDIMPALTCRALDSVPSSAAISASMSLRISAMAVCLAV